VLIVQHRRARAAHRAAHAPRVPADHERTFDRMRAKVMSEETVAQASTEVESEDLDGRFHGLEREQKIDSLLRELKSRKNVAP
jgi:phage shock protein A